MKELKDIKTKDDIKEFLLEGMEGMYKKSGEMVPEWICKLLGDKIGKPKLVKTCLQELISDNIVRTNTFYLRDENWMGLCGKKYPLTFENLLKFRKMVDEGKREEATDLYCELL